MDIIIIGGGAAGFFSAINIAEKNPNINITIIEKSNKLLSKVKISGGGRCNVTNHRSKPFELTHFYPRGRKKLNPVFKQFSTNDMVNWLEERGVKTKNEDDLRIFPITDNSQTLIDCFLRICKKYHIKIIQGEGLADFQFVQNKWKVKTNRKSYEADKVVIATGSAPSVWSLLKTKGFEIESAVPSLFTFNINDDRIKGLQGLTFPQVEIKIAKTKLKDSGPMLITHWGLSGPAILKLSSWGARELNDLNYQFEILIDFLASVEDPRTALYSYLSAHPKRIFTNYPLWNLPKRFWERLCKYSGIGESTCNELSKKQINKLLEELTQGRYLINGKSTFKEEFVTAGGVKLSEIYLSTFESKNHPGLYLAGEVLNIDALTGGFNFQACWSAGWIISESISSSASTLQD